MGRFPIYPCPQWAEFGSGQLRLDPAKIALWADSACHGAAALTTGRLRALGIEPTTADSPDGAAIVLGLSPEGERLEPPLPAEGYILKVSPQTAVVTGADASGCLYGASALCQLLRRLDGALAVPLVQVRDWPAKPMRGVHIYMPGRAEIPFFKDLLAWLASLRYNMLFLEVGGGMRYDRHPEVNEAWQRFCREARAFPGGPQALQQSQPYPKDSTHTELADGSFLEKSEVSDIIAFAKSVGIEVVPELQSLSHAYYMVMAHPEIAERPWDPYPDTYCPSNPRSYELYFDLVDEVLEVFRPRMLHIGHDEAYTFGICDRCRHKSGAELLAGDLNKIHDYLAARGVRTVLWGDKLQNIIIGGVNHGGRARRSEWVERGMDHTMLETYQAVDFVPKDMLIMDWYWSLDPLSERFFHRKGFDVIFGNFGNNFAPATFSRWPERSAGEHITGAEVSTWCDVSQYALGHNLALFNMLVSANMLWWQNYSDRDRADTLAAVAALQSSAAESLGDRVPSLHSDQYLPVPLSGAGNYTETALVGATGNWTEACPVPFTVATAAVQVRSGAELSQAIAIGRQATGIAFLHYCLCQRQPRPTWGYADPDQPDDYNLLGRYLITYTDGSTDEVDIRYGDNIARPNLRYGEDEASSCFWAVPAWEGYDRANAPVTLWATEWANPSPEKEIQDIKLHCLGDDPSERIVLLAVTLITG